MGVMMALSALTFLGLMWLAIHQLGKRPYYQYRVQVGAGAGAGGGEGRACNCGCSRDVWVCTYWGV